MEVRILDKKEVISKVGSTASKYSGVIKYVPKVKKGVTMVSGVRKNKGKLTKKKVEWMAAGVFVTGCLVKRILKY